MLLPIDLDSYFAWLLALNLVDKLILWHECENFSMVFLEDGAKIAEIFEVSNDYFLPVFVQTPESPCLIEIEEFPACRLVDFIQRQAFLEYFRNGLVCLAHKSKILIAVIFIVPGELHQVIDSPLRALVFQQSHFTIVVIFVLFLIACSDRLP
jgi:hypothetical protein